MLPQHPQPQISRSMGRQWKGHPALVTTGATCHPPSPAEISVTGSRARAPAGSRNTLKPGRKHPSGHFYDSLGRGKKKITEKGWGGIKRVKKAYAVTKEEENWNVKR